MAEPFTLVTFHAHPDDEALLTGGTLARAAAEGHRVVLVTATAGERGLTDGVTGQDLASRRRTELEASARALGCARVVVLGYADSGLAPSPEDRAAFAHQPVDEVAARLAEVLREERADVLTIYDARGGYGHPDHLQVHRVGTRAARLAGTPVVLEATVPGSLFRGVLRLLALVGSWVGRSAPLGLHEVFAARGEITHRIDVGDHLAAKRAALAAHASQRCADDGPRVIDWLLRLPPPVFAVALGREWFIEPGLPSGPVRTDVFASLRPALRSAGRTPGSSPPRPARSRGVGPRRRPSHGGTSSAGP
jgi:LmbE family N-acetylglucosaminyl deacetylase